MPRGSPGCRFAHPGYLLAICYLLEPAQGVGSGHRASLASGVDDRLVGGPAHPPGDPDLLCFAGGGIEAPRQHATPVPDISFGRRRGRRQQLDLDVVDFAHRNLVLDDDADWRVMAVANRSLDLPPFDLGGADDAGRAFGLPHGAARDLDLIV